MLRDPDNAKRTCNNLVASKSSKGPKIFLGVLKYAYRSYKVVQTVVDGEVAAQILLTPDTFHCYTGVIHTDYAVNSQDLLQSVKLTKI